MRPFPAPVLTLAAALLLSACGGTGDGAASADPAPDRAADALEVVVALYPYEYVLERVGGDDVRVTNVVPPGAEPHDLELSPRQVAAVAEADLVVWSRGFQPALDEAVDQQAGDTAVDVLSLVDVRRYDAPHEDAGHEDAGHEDAAHEDAGHEDAAHEDEDAGHAGLEDADHDHAGEDPHVWLDPTRLTTVARDLAEELARRAPERASVFRERADALAVDLQQLDEDYRAGLAECARRDVVTSHDAFGYLTDRYDLEQIAVSGLSPEAEPSVRRLADVARTARERGVTTIFFEETVSPRVAEQLAREVGATAEVLSPLEAEPEDGDYLTAMRANLDALRTALGCT